MNVMMIVAVKTLALYALVAREAGSRSQKQRRVLLIMASMGPVYRKRCYGTHHTPSLSTLDSVQQRKPKYKTHQNSTKEKSATKT